MILSFNETKGGVAAVSAPVMGGAGTSTATNIGSAGADLSGVWTGSDITDNGFVVYQSGNASTIIGGSGVIQFIDSTFATSPTTVTASGLTASTAYCAKPYAINAGGTSYGNEVCFSTIAPAAAGGISPQDITIDSSGNIYTSNYISNNVSKITPAGVSTIFATVGTSPIGMVFDSSGNLYVANAGSNNVSKITPAGISTIFATVGTSPVGIVADSSGNLYVANRDSNNVSKITPAGVSTIFATVGTNPYDITIDSSGNLYVTNISSNNVSKITPAGVSTIYGLT